MSIRRAAVKGGKRGERTTSDNPLSPTTVGDYVTLIKGVMNWAYEWATLTGTLSLPCHVQPRVRQEFVPAELWPRCVGTVHRRIVP